MSNFIPVISTVLAIALLILSIFVAVRTDVLKEGDGAYSFSRFQLWLWTTIICPAFMLRWGEHFPDLPRLNSTTLILLGLSGGTSLFSWIVSDIKKGRNQKTKKDLESKGFWNDILSDGNGNPSMSRLQQLLFTFAYLAVFISMFFSQLPVEYPDFDKTAFYLMGISQGTYLVAKFNE